MKEQFEDWRPKEATLETLAHATRIVDDYMTQGYILTIRQVYYRFVALDLFPEDRRWTWLVNQRKWIKDPDGTKNADPNYKWLGGLITRGRMAGMLDWDMFEDRHRETEENSHWRSPKSILRSASMSFQLDKWEDQPHRVIVMVEKDALAGILQPICSEMDVIFSANKGYSSSSHLYELGKRMNGFYYDEDQTPVVLYFGDHDPSGLDMDRDLEERLEMFGDIDLDVIRLALTMDQIEEHAPPPNPTKMTDTRAQGYIVRYGDDSWELDSMEPSLLAGLVRDAIVSYRDEDLWSVVVEKENNMKTRIKEMAESFND